MANVTVTNNNSNQIAPSGIAKSVSARSASPFPPTDPVQPMITSTTTAVITQAFAKEDFRNLAIGESAGGVVVGDDGSVMRSSLTKG
jgi:hypothetical protein